MYRWHATPEHRWSSQGRMMRVAILAVLNPSPLILMRDRTVGGPNADIRA